MKKLSIAKRFLLSIVVFTIPIVALLVSLYQAATESIEFTESEIRGVSLLQTLNQFESEYLQVLGENILSTQAPGEKLREADKRLKNLFDQAQTEESLKERVLNLWGEILRADLSKPETFKSIQAFKASLDDLRVEIGNKNLLILDPEIDSYYTMDLIIFNIPAIQAHLLRIAVAISNASTLDQQKYMGKIISSVDRVSEITSEANDKIRMIVEEDAKHAHSSGSFKAKRENLETQYSNLSKDLNGYWDSLDLTSVDVRVASYKRLLAIYNNSISIQKILLEELNHFLEEELVMR